MASLNKLKVSSLMLSFSLFFFVLDYGITMTPYLFFFIIRKFEKLLENKDVLA